MEYRFEEKKFAAYVGWGYFSLFTPSITAVLLTISGVYIANFMTLFIDFQPHFAHFTLIGLFNGLLFLWMNTFRPKYSEIFIQLSTVLKLLPLIFIASLGIISIMDGKFERNISKNPTKQY